MRSASTSLAAAILWNAAFIHCRQALKQPASNDGVFFTVESVPSTPTQLFKWRLSFLYQATTNRQHQNVCGGTRKNTHIDRCRNTACIFYVCINIHIYIYTYIHTHIHIYAYIYTYMVGPPPLIHIFLPLQPTQAGFPLHLIRNQVSGFRDTLPLSAIPWEGPSFKVSKKFQI